MEPEYFPLGTMNDQDTPEGLFESRSRSVSACNSGGSQDCIDKRELPLQTLNIREEVDEKFMTAIIEKHRKRRINSMLLVAPKSRVTTGADFGRLHDDIRHQVAVRYIMRCKVRSTLTRVLLVFCKGIYLCVKKKYFSLPTYFIMISPMDEIAKTYLIFEKKVMGECDILSEQCHDIGILL
jgi:hypothetical protein